MKNMKKNKNKIYPLKNFLILWSTQSISQLGSSITAFALTLWLYEQTGSALSTAALTICSYAPYVLMSIFAGALTDRFDKKKTGGRTKSSTRLPRKQASRSAWAAIRCARRSAITTTR